MHSQCNCRSCASSSAGTRSSSKTIIVIVYSNTIIVYCNTIIVKLFTRSSNTIVVYSNTITVY